MQNLNYSSWWIRWNWWKYDGYWNWKWSNYCWCWYEFPWWKYAWCWYFNSLILLILEKIKDKIVGIINTHGHEDHIGAMPYLFKEMQFPVYGTSLPLEMIGSKFDEHKMKNIEDYLELFKKELL